jgi:anti-sigma factor RsiW
MAKKGTSGGSRENPPDLTCREFAGFLADYLDETLPPGQQRVFEAHLQECRACAVYLASYRYTIRLTRSVSGADPEDAPPADVPEELIQAVLAAIRKKD